jgi:hypothetical protein
MDLTSENVEKVFTDCLFKDDENTDNHVVGEGVMSKFGFHPDRLESHKEDLSLMLKCLPASFQAENGGGMSFLNACNDKDGKQWTGMHNIMEMLFAMGVALGLAKYLMPRDMWGMMPGGMPYIAIN